MAARPRTVRAENRNHRLLVGWSSVVKQWSQITQFLAELFIELLHFSDDLVC